MLRGSAVVATLAAAGVLLAAGAAATALGATPAAGGPLAPLHPDGRWLKDRAGRIVIVHGLQVAHKTPPYLPPARSFTDRDARWIASLGFNSVRLAWFWSGVEPRQGAYDERYIARYAAQARMLMRRGIFVLAEAHQDVYSERVFGAGFPDWATLTDGLPPGGRSGFSDYFKPATLRAFDSLNSNRDGLQDAFAAAWGRMAGALRADPRLLGYDLYNEPWPGSAVDQCGSARGCPAWDRDVLGPLQDRLARAVRAHDRRGIAWYEPNLFFDFARPTYLSRRRADVGPVGFSFHAYCTAGAARPDRESTVPGYARKCGRADGRVFSNGEAAARRLGGPPLFAEFGDTQDVRHIQRLVDLADSRRDGWLYWGWKDWVDVPGGKGHGALFANSDDDSTFRARKAAALAEPYPMATAGVPLAWRFDPATKVFTFRWRPGAAIAAPTVVAVPPINFPRGYRVSVRGARVVSRPGAARLALRADRASGSALLRLTAATG